MLIRRDLIDRYKSLPVCIIEANPQRKINGKNGWEDSSTLWITECVSYVKDWNADIGHRPITGETRKLGNV